MYTTTNKTQVLLNNKTINTLQFQQSGFAASNFFPRLIALHKQQTTRTVFEFHITAALCRKISNITCIQLTKITDKNM